MKVTLSIDERIVLRARKQAAALGKSLSQLVCDYLRNLDSKDDVGRSIEEFRRLSGRGISHHRRFDRNEIHERL